MVTPNPFYSGQENAILYQDSRREPRDTNPKSGPEKDWQAGEISKDMSKKVEARLCGLESCHGGEFTQPSLHLFWHACTVAIWVGFASSIDSADEMAEPISWNFRLDCLFFPD